MKNKWLILVALVAVLAFATYGANAYFSSERTTTGYISSGTLTLKLGLAADGPWGNTVALPWNFTNMAPGDVVSGDLFMKNVGTIDSDQITFEWQNILNNPEAVAFADQIFVTEFWDSEHVGETRKISECILYVDENGDGNCSLSELAYASEKYGFDFDDNTNAEDVPFLPANAVESYHMKFQFNPEAGNEYQGVSLSYGLIVTAEQKLVYPPTPVPAP